MDDITFVRSHWWLVSEGFSLSTANSDVQKLPATLYHAYCRFPRLCRLKCVKSSLVDSPWLSGTFGNWISCPDILHLSGPISWTS